MNRLIEDKLAPAMTGINQEIDKKLEPISKKLDDVADKVNDAEGQLKRLHGDLNEQKRKQDQQTSLAKLMDPNRVLGIIRTEIQLAEDTRRPLSASNLVDYRNVVQTIPSSTREYWTTVAAIINYQSLLNQLSGEAPDPAKVSHPCAGLTAGTGGSNLIIGATISNCVLDLDTTHNVLEGLVIRNSVVRYHGGPVALHNVVFANCSFVLDLANSPQTPLHPDLLLSLLDSDQKQVKLSTHT